MTDFHGAEEAMVDAWVLAKLNAHFTADNAGFAGIADRIFSYLAPEKATFPYIIYQAQSPPRVIRGVGPAEVMVDTLYVVKAVAQTASYTPLAPVASGIRTALVTTTGETFTDGAVFACQYETQHALTEVESGTQFRQFGGLFRIQAQAA